MRVVAAGIGALGIDRAQACLAIEVKTVSVGQPGQGEDAVLLIEMFNEAFFGQAFGDALERLVTLESVDHFEADQVIDPHLDR